MPGFRCLSTLGSGQGGDKTKLQLLHRETIFLIGQLRETIAITPSPYNYTLHATRVELVQFFS